MFRNHLSLWAGVLVLAGLVGFPARHTHSAAAVLHGPEWSLKSTASAWIRV